MIGIPRIVIQHADGSETELQSVLTDSRPGVLQTVQLMEIYQVQAGDTLVGYWSLPEGFGVSKIQLPVRQAP